MSMVLMADATGRIMVTITEAGMVGQVHSSSPIRHAKLKVILTLVIFPWFQTLIGNYSLTGTFSIPMATGSIMSTTLIGILHVDKMT